MQRSLAVSTHGNAGKHTRLRDPLPITQNPNSMTYRPAKCAPKHISIDGIYLIRSFIRNHSISHEMMPPGVFPPGPLFSHYFRSISQTGPVLGRIASATIRKNVMQCNPLGQSRLSTYIPVKVLVGFFATDRLRFLYYKCLTTLWKGPLQRNKAGFFVCFLLFA